MSPSCTIDAVGGGKDHSSVAAVTDPEFPPEHKPDVLEPEPPERKRGVLKSATSVQLVPLNDSVFPILDGVLPPKVKA